ncbi:MAG: iron-containing alcohol dehydrogenase [Planctomycetota bacterium]
MINPITINVPGSIEFGAGKINTLTEHLKQNKRVFVLVDKPVVGIIKPIIVKLIDAGKKIEVSTEVVPEPPIESLQKLLAPVKAFAPDAVVGIGGGSAMDLAKVTAVLFDSDQTTDEIIGIGNVNKRSVKLITASTTSGTGSEVTPIAVLTDTEAGLKKGVVSNHIISDVAIVDPELTVGMPPAVTAATGMDAITHCIEAYTNHFSHPLIDSLALQGIKLMSNSLEAAVKNGDDLDARADMSLGSLYGGLCLGPVNTAAVHALAYPLGGVFKISHGMSNSLLLPFVMQFNLPSCIDKYAEIGQTMGLEGNLSNESMATATIKAIRDLSSRCGIPGDLKSIGIPESAIPEMADAAMQVQRLLNNNPREVTVEDAQAIYKQAYEGSFSF